ncbi:FAD-dependent monooxygenase [Streptomyces scabiei]|uniref:FAD-dependent monooxygenase n=1 Tax=Streptomyces griseiscabiei TaxID=2993540 RepID=UPI000A38C6D1|nr:FAD-dependent monooxygenase [Streptomyces griseiscabiei]
MAEDQRTRAGNRVDTQVVVVGAGPVGLMLAAELRLGGADVIVLERLLAPTSESRASTLHARTMELFDSRGLLDALGTAPGDIRGHFGGIPLDLTLPTSHPGQWKVPQDRTEALLGAWAGGLGADVRRGHEVTALTVTEDHVDVEAVGPSGPLTVRALCVVGCDGEHSTVRRLAGLDFPGANAARELIRADVAGIEVPNRRFERLDAGLAIAARRGDGVTRIMVHEFGRTAVPRTSPPDFAELATAWKRVTGEDVSGGTPLWINAFGDVSRQAARYRDGRVLLAGDAAHAQMPIGGQALNLGLQDAANLGWKLAVQVARKGSQGLLDSYHAERHAVGERVLSGIRAQALLLLRGPEVNPLRAVLGELIRSDDTRRHLAATISGLDIRYDVGPGDHPLLGRRLPPSALETADGRPTSTAELLRGGRGLLLDLSGDGGRTSEPAAVAAPWRDRVHTVAATVTDGGLLSDLDAVLVRPDGYVVWTGSDGTSPEAALHRWLGLPHNEHPISGGLS